MSIHHPKQRALDQEEVSDRGDKEDGPTTCDGRGRARHSPSKSDRWRPKTTRPSTWALGDEPCEHGARRVPKATTGGELSVSFVRATRWEKYRPGFAVMLVLMVK